MKRLKLNPEFFYRHLAVCLLMFGMGCWFGYDGFVRYPATPAQSQYGFTALCLLASVLIGLNIASAAAFRFEHDDKSFTWNGKLYALSDVKSVDRSKWKKKGIVKLLLADGSHVTLDCWHHLGVKDFEKLLPTL